MKRASQTWAFRAKPEVQERLEMAKKLGINVSEVVNDCLPKRLDEAIRDKSRELRQVLEAMPA